MSLSLYHNNFLKKKKMQLVTNNSSRHAAICCPRRVSRELCAVPVNIAAGAGPSPPSRQSAPKASSSSDSKPIKVQSSSLPTILAGLSSSALIAAAALHLGDVDHAVAIASAASGAVAPLREFGPGDVLMQNFGPSRPLWSLLVNSQHTSVAASASHSLAHSLLHDARSTIADAAAAARDTVDKVCDEYNNWLEESPLVCKIVTGNFFTVAGDMLAQLGLGGSGGGHGGEEAADAAPQSRADGGRRRVDLMRTGRLCLETSAVGTPLGHWWFGLLDSSIMPEDPHCPAAVLTKMLADQVFFAPLGLLLFFVVIKCLEGRPRDIPRAVKTSYVKALLGGYLLWPVAGILNFALLPNEYRLLFNNCVNIIWTCFLSIMSSGGGEVDGEKLVHCPSDGASAAASADPRLTSQAGASSGIIEATVIVAAAAAAAASGRPSFAHMAGLSVAAIEAVLLAHGSQMDAAAPALSPAPFAAGGSVSIGGPCLEACEQPVDALYETR